jgi:hypothetical protein
MASPQTMPVSIAARQNPDMPKNNDKQCNITWSQPDGTVIVKQSKDKTAFLGVTSLDDTGPKTLALLQVTEAAPLGDDLNTDKLLESIYQASSGGEKTAGYFKMINSMSKVYAKITTQGSSAFIESPDKVLEGSKVYCASINDVDGTKTNAFYVQISAQNITLENGKVVEDKDTKNWTYIDGKTYKPIGIVTMETGCFQQNLTFSRTSWQLATGVEDGLESTKFFPLLSNVLLNTAKNVGERIKGFSDTFGKTDDAKTSEDAAIKQDKAAIEDILKNVKDLLIKIPGAADTVTYSFIGIAIIQAVVFFAIMNTEHKTFHNLRVWNLTEYRLRWYIYFDNSVLFFKQGEYIRAPADFDSKSTNLSYLPIEPLQNTTPKKCSYGDFTLTSNSSLSGIGYVIRLQLIKPDPNPKNPDKVIYTGAALFDIPWMGKNSLAVTFNSIDIGKGEDDDLQAWYSKKAGKSYSQTTAATESTAKNEVTITATYDYLQGKHPLPYITGKKDDGYWYQSIITLEQSDLLNGQVIETTTDEPEGPVPYTRGFSPKLSNYIYRCRYIEDQEAATSPSK